ncbi:hypothetical protein BFW38_16050 [Terasakiispira papahanaumokuakeensis]|uniref:HTH lacI-type domain-containing protein n=2 Tax=Terasakiispira papahanaumokuakeensis TaxID=197479 RepID=A0A1E2VDC5_9GAMM|nr:hypothetical protein BFW38_16050 [Terasakiispira papahanaumokuakeensis]
MQDVADIAGVSLSTVDRILNRRTNVRSSTLQHVLETAERIGFYGSPVIRDRLSEQAPSCTFGFLLNPIQRTLYREFAERLVQRTLDASCVQGTPKVLHIERLSEEMMINGLYRLAEYCQVIAAVVFDTPAIHAALRDLTSQGCAVIAMFTDVTSPECIAFVGADPTKMGRGAGWIMHALSPDHGQVLVLSGSPQYSAHRAYIAGFHSYMSEAPHSRRISPVQYTAENDSQAESLVRAAIAQQQVTGIVMVGGGLEGVIRAVQESVTPLTVIGTESSQSIDRALVAHEVDAVISHPLAEVVEHTVSLMEDFILSGRRGERKNCFVKAEIRISEIV